MNARRVIWRTSRNFLTSDRSRTDARPSDGKGNGIHQDVMGETVVGVLQPVMFNEECIPEAAIRKACVLSEPESAARNA